MQSELPVDISDRRMTKSGYKLEKTNGAPRAFFYFAKKTTHRKPLINFISYVIINKGGVSYGQQKIQAKG